MFIGEEITVKASFRPAQARLTNLTQDDWLSNASKAASDEGAAVLKIAWPPAVLADISGQIRVRSRDPVVGDDIALLTIRWEVAGHGSGLVAVLDADITLTPVGEDATRLTLAGAYRPMLAYPGLGPDEAVIRRMASATMGSLLTSIADAIAHPGKQRREGKQLMALSPWRELPR